MKSKRILSLILASAILICCLSGCGSKPAAKAENTRVFTDSLGREVLIPEKIERIAATAPLAQMLILPIAGDMLTGITNEPDKFEEKYLNEKVMSLPVLGQLYGGKGDLNLESLLAAAPQVVIDIGDAKATTAEDLDALSQQTGIPFVHISASIGTMDKAFTMLGELLGLETEAKVFADYCAKTWKLLEDTTNAVPEKKNLLYIAGEEGLNVIANTSFHAEIIDMISNNLAVVDAPVSKGTGNEVDMEQMLKWNPDYIFLSPESIYETIGTDPNWQGVTAIKNGDYYEVPEGPYNWMGFPPSVQRLLGMMWMLKVLYPEQATYDLYEKVSEYYELFYGYELGREEYDALMVNSLGR